MRKNIFEKFFQIFGQTFLSPREPLANWEEKVFLVEQKYYNFFINRKLKKLKNFH